MIYFRKKDGPRNISEQERIRNACPGLSSPHRLYRNGTGYDTHQSNEHIFGGVCMSLWWHQWPSFQDHLQFSPFTWAQAHLWSSEPWCEVRVSCKVTWVSVPTSGLTGVLLTTAATTVSGLLVFLSPWPHIPGGRYTVQQFPLSTQAYLHPCPGYFFFIAVTNTQCPELKKERFS